MASRLHPEGERREATIVLRARWDSPGARQSRRSMTASAFKRRFFKPRFSRPSSLSLPSRGARCWLFRSLFLGAHPPSSPVVAWFRLLQEALNLRRWGSTTQLQGAARPWCHILRSVEPHCTTPLRSEGDTAGVGGSASDHLMPPAIPSWRGVGPADARRLDASPP